MSWRFRFESTEKTKNFTTEARRAQRKKNLLSFVLWALPAHTALCGLNLIWFWLVQVRKSEIA